MGPISDSIASVGGPAPGRPRPRPARCGADRGPLGNRRSRPTACSSSLAAAALSIWIIHRDRLVHPAGRAAPGRARPAPPGASRSTRPGGDRRARAAPAHRAAPHDDPSAAIRAVHGTSRLRRETVLLGLPGARSLLDDEPASSGLVAVRAQGARACDVCQVQGTERIGRAMLDFWESSWCSPQRQGADHHPQSSV